MNDAQQPLLNFLSNYFERYNAVAHKKVCDALAEFKTSPSRKLFFKLIALSPRWVDRKIASYAPSLQKNETQKSSLESLDPIFSVNLTSHPWQNDQLCRLWIICASQTIFSADSFAQELDTLFNTADTNELEVLYRCLPFLTDTEKFNARGREGARTNIIPVFLAIAHNNTFAADFFDLDGWNQLILKAMFNACALDPVIGLEKRNNAELARKLTGYVRERWVADRNVPFEIWRCIGPFAREVGALDLLEKALTYPDDYTPRAAVLALQDCNTDEAHQILKAHPDLVNQTESLDWHQLAKLAETEQNSKG